MYRVWNFITAYSALLVSGAIVALVWANVAPASYLHFVEYPVWFNPWIGVDVHSWTRALGAAAHAYEIGDVEKVVTLHYLVNDIAMALFFAMAGKEVWEALILKNGALRGRKAATPMVATAGGMVGPIVVYLGLATLMGSDTYDAVVNGWAVPTATDIALSFIIGRMVFGAGHPAVRFLLLLAVADDAAGLLILTVFYPSGALAPAWLLLSVGASVFVYVAFNALPRRMDRGDQMRRRSTWVRKHLRWYPYALAGLISLFAFTQSGLHPALGLLPVIPAIPHADRAFGVFADAERHLHDILNQMQHALTIPVEIILFVFGLVNAGVAFAAISGPSWPVLGGLVIGKPLGIFLFGAFAAHVLRLGLPEGMRTVDLVVIGFTAAIGFTFALFMAGVAFEPGEVRDAAKWGALLSFGAVIPAILLGQLSGIRKQNR